jgi:hypothetical protein
LKSLARSKNSNSCTQIRSLGENIAIIEACHQRSLSGAKIEQKHQTASPPVTATEPRKRKILGSDRPLCAKGGRTSNANGRTKSNARHRSVQPIIIGRKAPRFLKSLSRNLGDFRPRKRTQFGRGPVSVGRCRCFPQDFYKRFKWNDQTAAPLLFCKQRRRKHETHDNSISLCVRALQYVRACKNGSS